MPPPSYKSSRSVIIAASIKNCSTQRGELWRIPVVIFRDFAYWVRKNQTVKTICLDRAAIRLVALLFLIGLGSPKVCGQLPDSLPIVQEFSNEKEPIASRIAAGRNLELPDRLPASFVPVITSIALKSREDTEIRELAMEILSGHSNDASSALDGLTSVLADRNQALALRTQCVRTIGAIASATQIRACSH